jgi:hypothetical protein
MDIHLVEEIIDITDNAAKVVKRISGVEAFRQYGWLRDVPMTNIAGNYRGMVISGEMKTVYLYSSSVGDKVSNLGTLISLAGEVMKSRNQISAIMGGNDVAAVKAAKLSSQISGIASRVVAHQAGGIIRSFDWMLRTSRWVNVCYWVDREHFMQTLGNADQIARWLDTKVDFYLSGESIYYFSTICASRLS